MKYQFGVAEVDKWAKFSGDFNPIHFDLAHAGLLGMQELIVHGMLAIMPAKQSVWNQHRARASNDSKWIKFRTLFRNPLPHEAKVALTTSGNTNSSFRVHALAGGLEHFRGACGTGTAPARDDGVATLEGSCPVPMEQVSAFFAAYPDVTDPWIALDAVIFSEFMRTKIETIYAIAVQHSSAASNLETAQPVIVHSSHTVTFDADRLGSQSHEFPWKSLTYGLMEPDFIRDDKRLICTIPIWIKSGTEHVMSVEIGVVAVFN